MRTRPGPEAELCFEMHYGDFGPASVAVDFGPLERGEQAIVTLEFNDKDGECEHAVKFAEERLTDLLAALGFAANEIRRRRQIFDENPPEAVMLS